MQKLQKNLSTTLLSPENSSNKPEEKEEDKKSQENAAVQQVTLTPKVDSGKNESVTKQEDDVAQKPLVPILRKSHATKSIVHKKNKNFVNINKMFPIQGTLGDFARPPVNYEASFSYEKYKHFKQIALEAYQNEKIFVIVGGNFQTLRQELIKRGWIEKFPNTNPKDNISQLSQYDLLRLAREGNDYERVALAKLLVGCVPNFIWQPRYSQDYTGNNYYPFRNRIPRKSFHFTSKEGLCECNDHKHWYFIPDRVNLNCPRSYRLAQTESLRDFLENYRLSACLAFLVFLLEQKCQVSKFCVKGGTIPTSSIEFATRRINEWLNVKNHADIDALPIYNPDRVYIVDWHAFYKHYRGIVHNDEKFHEIFPDVMTSYMLAARKVVDAFLELNPGYKKDGFYNLWILKPSHSSRGYGIQIMGDDTKILNYVDKHKRQHRYVVQKYIERPLLIYKTKFDIRQYVLLTVDGGVSIWMYKNCYLRFSSQEYHLKNMNESIHLTNHAIQKKYTNGIRHTALPSHNMWSLDQFKEYLLSIDRADVWDQKIYPGLKQCVVAMVLCTFDETDYEKNCFELYGCDFMIDENFEPSLIEVNASPDLSHCTPVTAKICKQVLIDLIKVVIDRYEMPTISTGDFELIERIDLPALPTFCSGLSVNGERIKMPTPITKTATISSPSYAFSTTNKPASTENKKFREAGLIPDASGNLQVLIKEKEAPTKPNTELKKRLNSILKSQTASKKYSEDLNKVDFIERNRKQIQKRKLEFEQLKLLNSKILQQNQKYFI